MSLSSAVSMGVLQTYLKEKHPDWSVGPLMGEGAYAQVWSITGAPDKVGKVTYDEAELTTARAVMLAQSLGKAEGLVRIYDYWKSDSRYFGNRLLVLLEEKLEPLTDVQMDAWIYSSLDVARGTYRVSDVYDPGLGDYRPRNFWEDKKDWTKAPALNLYAIHKSCQEAGIVDHSDWHVGNVMNRPGYGMVLSDLGMTSTPHSAVQAWEELLKTAKDGPIGAQVGG